ncbi:sugar phosphate isomerase/epimerase family protein [Salipiger sp.]|uniref:sugar phosphate isomerase/epimerase family protein n=1 Tax=Salipiger sp. TaxID=2078585 RepID=UPI003A97C341
MTRRLSVAHLSAVDLPPAQFVEAAARAGFDAVGLRLLRVTPETPGHPLMDDPAALRETLAALRDTGLAVNDIEFLRITPETDIASLGALFDCGAELGASHLITAPYDDDLARLAETLGRVDEAAAERGMSAVLEFFPWAVVPDLAACWRMVQQAGPRVGILADSLHADRSGSSLDLLGQIPANRLPFAHLCDAPVHPPYTTDELFHTARVERLVPGTGEIDLAAFVAALPPETALGVEVPMTARTAEIGAPAVLAELGAATRAFLDAL